MDGLKQLAEREQIAELSAPIKHDTGKLRMDLVLPEMIEALARGLGYGAKKYCDNNYLHGGGMDWSRIYAAAIRHLVAWYGGEDLDKESGLSHLDHAMCCLGMLKVYEERHVGKDNRGASVEAVADSGCDCGCGTVRRLNDLLDTALSQAGPEYGSIAGRIHDICARLRNLKGNLMGAGDTPEEPAIQDDSFNHDSRGAGIVGDFPDRGTDRAEHRSNA